MSGKYKVYFLMDDREVVYIGCSTQPEKRAEVHADAGMVFDRYAYESFDNKEDALYVERELTLEFKPKYNPAHVRGTCKVSRVVKDLNTRYLKVTEDDVIQCANEIGQEVIDFNGTPLLVGSTVELRKYIRTVRDDDKRIKSFNIKKVSLDGLPEIK